MESRAAGWDSSRSVVDRLHVFESYEEPHGEARLGKWQGRRIIGRDAKINGGVYLGSGTREAIVVDDEKQSKLKEIYQELIKRRHEKEATQNIPFNHGILEEIYNLTTETIKYDKTGMENVAAQYADDKKVGLEAFINAKAGVCRHQALLAGYLLEKLIEEGHISGKASIDRNSIGGIGGHAWVRFTRPNNEVFILDPAQKYVGALKSIPKDTWFYERPSDQPGFRGKMAKVIETLKKINLH